MHCTSVAVAISKKDFLRFDKYYEETNSEVKQILKELKNDVYNFNSENDSFEEKTHKIGKRLGLHYEQDPVYNTQDECDVINKPIIEEEERKKDAERRKIEIK